MDPVTGAALRSWEWRLEVLLPLLLAGVLYSAGWRRLHNRRERSAGLANGWRLLAYWSGLVLVGLALLSPIDALADQLFFMHMIQHLLLVMLAPPLMMLANPLPFLLWGLPTEVRHHMGCFLSTVLHRNAASRRYLRALTQPGIVWMLFVIIFVGWHDPDLYDAALRSNLVHDVEHLTFFGSAALYWWHVVGAGPRLHKRLSPTVQVVYVLAAIPPNMLTGLVLAFAPQPVYTHYLSVPRLWGISALEDQMLGGVIMWVPGSMMYIIVILILTGRWLQGEERKPPLPVTKWATEEQMVAPGLDK